MQKARRKEHKDYLTYGALFFLSIAIVFGIYFLIQSAFIMSPFSGKGSEQMPKERSSVRLTAFDQELALRLMDKDRDGKCDACGMDVQMCISSGQLECSMDPNAHIGILGTDHVHATFKVYLNRDPIHFNDERYFVKSSFAHVEPEADPAATGNVLHIHATGVPLWLFFESLGMAFNTTCFQYEGKDFCNDESNKLSFFVNGVEEDTFWDYIPEDRDKMLITYESRNEDLGPQLASITNFTKDNH